MATKWSAQHFWALDIAMGQALSIEIKGKTYKFSPIKHRQLGELVSLARADALKSWRMANADVPSDPAQYRQRNMEMNAILFGAAGQAVLDFLSFPTVRRRLVEMSLKVEHPDASADLIDSFFDDEEIAEQLVEVVYAWSMGPRSLEAGKAGKSTAENPPGPLTDSTTTSAP